MNNHGLSHVEVDGLINLDKMVASAAIAGGKGIVMIDDRVYRTDYNQATSINAALDVIRDKIDDNGIYVDISILYQTLTMKGTKISHGYFRKFVDICSSVPREIKEYPLHRPPIVFDDVTKRAEDDVINEWSIVLTTIDKLGEEVIALAEKNKALLEAHRNHVHEKASELLCKYRKLVLADRLIDDNMLNIDMYCYRMTFSTALDMAGYTFNGHRLTEEDYTFIIADEDASLPITMYIIAPYIIDGYKNSYKTGRFTRRYCNRVTEFIKPGSRGGICCVVKMAADCYVSTVDIVHM